MPRIARACTITLVTIHVVHWIWSSVIPRFELQTGISVICIIMSFVRKLLEFLLHGIESYRSRGRSSKLGAMSPRVADAMAVSTWSFDSVRQVRLDFLRLTRWDLLTVFSFNYIDDLEDVGIQGHSQKLRHRFEQELQLPSLSALDVLMCLAVSRDPKWLAGMIIIASGDLGVASLDTVVCSNAKRAVCAGPTASTDSMTVAVKDMGSPVAFDGPVAKRILEVCEGCEDLALDDRRHGRSGGANVVLGVGGTV